MTCSCCGEQAAEIAFAAVDADGGERTFDVALCSACRSGRMRVFPAPGELDAWYDDAYYGRGGSKFSPPLQMMVDWAVRRQAARIRRALPGKANPRVLDIGCGRGTLIRALAHGGAHCIGLERAKHVANSGPGFEIRDGELAEQAFPAGHFDAVILWHVLEHLPAPIVVIEEILRLLAPGGLLLIAVPNNDSCQARAFGRHWFHVDAPRHLHFFGHRGLTALLARKGLEVVGSTTADAVQNVFGFIQSSLNLIPGSSPNRMYRLMRSNPTFPQILELLAWSLPASLLVLPALAEYALSAMAGRGGCSILYLRRADA
jgi:SAM-dependent methyltransferase